MRKAGSRNVWPFTRLLIIDEFAYLPFWPDGAHLFFQLVSRRYERGSHHSHVLTMRGDS